MGIDCEYLGNFSVEPTRAVGFVCEGCKVAWDGCTAAACCPRCGDEKDCWADLETNEQQPIRRPQQH